MKEQFISGGYSITTNPQFQNKRYGITPELDKQLGMLAIECQNKNNKKMISKITGLIIQYPKVPLLKNFLSVAYSVQGNHEKAIEVNNWLITEHPDYLFAKINSAYQYIEKAQYEKVPDVLGQGMEIKLLYPERDLFHLSEVTAFYRVAIRYYTAIENLELAENRMEILKEIAPDHKDTKQAEVFLGILRLKKGIERLEEDKQRITPKEKRIVSKLSDKDAPQFNHPEIQNLYQFGLGIPHEKLKEIIALPSASLIADLENILIDANNRFDYFKELEYNEETHSFVLHALFLLKEINATESLPKILSILGSDDEFLDFWLGDHKTATLWQCIYGLGISNTAMLKQFLLQPGIDTYCKTAVSEALCQIVLHCTEKREEILTIYSDVFTIFSVAADEDNLLDAEFLGLAICDVLDCKLHELLPIIKVLFDKGYVAHGVCGDYKEIVNEFGKISKNNPKKDLYNIFELYDHVLTTWAGYNEDENGLNDKANKYFTPPVIPQQAISDKIGRNDLCPCGSGKKYKKCCMKLPMS